MLKADRRMVTAEESNRVAGLRNRSHNVTHSKFTCKGELLKVTVTKMSGTNSKHSSSWEIINLCCPRKKSGETNRKYISVLDIYNSIIQYGKIFAEEYDIYSLEGKKLDVGQDRMQPKFLDRKINYTYIRFYCVGKLFYAQRKFLNVEKCMIVAHREHIRSKSKLLMIL